MADRSTPYKARQSKRQFDYFIVKKKYLAKILEVSRLQSAQSYFNDVDIWNMDQEWIENTISELRKCEEQVKLGQTIGVENQLWNKYQIARDGDKDILILKPKGPYDPVIEVLSYNDSFDVLVDTHKMTGHGGPEKMSDMIKKHYSMPSQCAAIFTSVCNICQSVKEVPKKKPALQQNHKVYVDILDFRMCPDGDFNYLLTYVNKKSGFTLLRPLMKANMIYGDEAALELLNIFLNFGPPGAICVAHERYHFFKSLLDITSLLCDCDIVICKRRKSVEAARVLRSLQEWMMNTHCPNWAIACRLLQWKINCSDTRSDEGELGKPYHWLYKLSQRSNNWQNPFNMEPLFVKQEEMDITEHEFLEDGDPLETSDNDENNESNTLSGDDLEQPSTSYSRPETPSSGDKTSESD